MPPNREILRRLERIEQLLEDLARAGPGRRGELLSRREAARRLRVDRTPGATLDQLLRSGRLRAVPALNGRGIRIPSEEVDRVLRNGLPPPPAAPRARRLSRARREASPSEAAAAIRAIPIPKLDE